LLQSYVPEWPGVMCIYGVTQIGTGSLGPSRFLPDLLITLQVIKPALVFLTGTWFVLYWVNRHTTTAPLMSRVLLLLLLLGFVAIVDSIVEAAYLAIPKKEEFASSGCCTDAFGVQSRSSKLLSEGLLGEDYRPWLSGAYYLVNAGMSLALAGYALLPRWRQSGACLVPLGLGALVSLAVNFAFLMEIAAPALLHSPYHHCPYDLVPLVPESVVAIALFVVGCFSAGWACLAVWLGSCPETKPFLGQEITKLVYLALFGYAGSVAMLWLELRLA